MFSLSEYFSRILTFQCHFDTCFVVSTMILSHSAFLLCLPLSYCVFKTEEGITIERSNPLCPTQVNHHAYNDIPSVGSSFPEVISSIHLLPGNRSSLSSTPPAATALVSNPRGPKENPPKKIKKFTNIKMRPKSFTILSSFLLYLRLSRVLAAYTLIQDYTGPAFFEGFEFFTQPDPTNGYVTFVDEETANATALAGFLPSSSSSSSSAGNNNGSANPVYLGVDSTTVLSGAGGPGRNALRMYSTRTYEHGLVIADIAHMPGGICGVWPAFWMLGTSATWPLAGEIDIVEGVHDQRFNRMTLHTDAGVVVANDTSSFTGDLVTADCDVNAPDQDKNAGCQIADQPTTPSFGVPFNQMDGGVFAVEWTAQSIQIWFFPRSNVPPDVLLSTSPGPTTTGWGEPNALFAGNFSLDAHFQQMQIIFDTTFCGDWAGQTWSSTPECAALAPTCEEYVAAHPEAFQDAYWAIRSLRVFQQAESGSSSSTPSSPPTSTTSAAPAGDTVVPVSRMRRRKENVSFEVSG